MNLHEEAKAVAQVESDINHLEKSVDEATQSLEDAERTLARTQAAQEIIQLVAQAVQQKAHERIARVVSDCLTAVFDDPYKFEIEFERKRGRTEAKLLFTRRGLSVDPLTASGGGVVDVAAFALRVSCLMLHRPRLGRFIVLDEPFRFVSAEYQENVKAMLEGLSKDLKLQILQVTHNDALTTGKVIEL